MKKICSLLFAAAILTSFSGCDDEGGNYSHNGNDPLNKLIVDENPSSARDSDNSSRSSKKSEDGHPDWDVFRGTGYIICADGSEWEKQNSSDISASVGSNVDLVLVSGKKSSFRPNINVIISGLTEDVPDLEAYVKYTVDCVDKYDNIKYMEQKKGKANGIKGYYMYLEEKVNNVNLGCYQFICVNDGKAYVFTMTDRKNRIDEHEEEFREIMDTLEFFSY